MNESHIYRYRAVAFLDVLGFQESLISFDEEARRNRYESEEDDDSEYFYSKSASNFIDTLYLALGKLSPEKFKFYLFSDNVCITSIAETSAEDLKVLLFTISELFFDLATQGYFIRGGIDYGLFIDDDNLALGIPLAEAYKMESKQAIYPRVLLSKGLVDQFIEEEVFLDDISILLVSKSHELNFLNIFTHVFKSEDRSDKETFFVTLKRVINQELESHKNNEKLYLRFRWLAEKFNLFIDDFVTNLAYQDTSFDPDEEEGYLEFIKNQKIDYA